MALQTSGAISFADLQTEFGGTNPISLSEYIRNIGDTSLDGGFKEIRYTPIVDGTTFKLGVSTAPTNLFVQKHQKLILDCEDANMTFSSNKVYFSTSQTLGNNNLITTGVITRSRRGSINSDVDLDDVKTKANGALQNFSGLILYFGIIFFCYF